MNRARRNPLRIGHVPQLSSLALGLVALVVLFGLDRAGAVIGSVVTTLAEDRPSGPTQPAIQIPTGDQAGSRFQPEPLQIAMPGLTNPPTPSPLAPVSEPGAHVELQVAPGFSMAHLRSFLVATGSRICMVEIRNRTVMSFVAPGDDGMPMIEQPRRRWNDFVAAHPSGDWLWIPCTSDCAAFASLRAAWPGGIPCLILAPAETTRVLAELRRRAPAGADASNFYTIVELTAAGGASPRLNVTFVTRGA